MSVEAALAALRHDAALWDEVAQVTRSAGLQATALGVGERQLSWASVPTGLAATYAATQQKVVALLGEATTTFSDLSAALDEVARGYERSDDDAVSRFGGVWEIRD